jgi:hypothetical protein
MPNVKIDYSNTIFYKIYCKDSNISDLYIGHTTNFVQRKHGHKQSCINPKAINHNCKLYKVIRDNSGWDNWNMDIIAFHNCEDLLSAKRYEQQYYKDYKANLNSIEPLPLPKPKENIIIEKKEKQILYCNVCKIYFGTKKLYDIHNNTKKHIKKLSLVETTQMLTDECSKKVPKFFCKKCDYKCYKQSVFDKHLSTQKHIMLTDKCSKKVPKFFCKKCDYKCYKQSVFDKHLSTQKHIMLTNDYPKNVPNFECECGKKFKYRQGLHKHKQSCVVINNEIQTEKTNNEIQTEKTNNEIQTEKTNNEIQTEKTNNETDANLVLHLLKENSEFKQLLFEQQKQIQEQQKQIQEQQ